mmetsp:Transcript_1833/g.2706  ORF Transcript_1833/g.2706 Transcript_1833/m.2706 type:complete len:848 (+) Transcript_1833:73-2616(+)
MAPPTVSYESFAPRSAEQIARLRRLEALTAGPVRIDKQQPKNESSWTMADAMSVNTSDSKISLSSDTTTMSRAYKTCDQVTTVLKHSTSLRLALRASINICDDISNRHAELLRHSGELSASADRLQAEEAQLNQHATEIGLPLRHYDAVDRIGILVGVLFRGTRVVRGLAKVKVDHEEYPELLLEIDEAVDFFGRECGGPLALEEAIKTSRRKPAGGGGANNNAFMLSGSMEYYRRSLDLQEAALYLIQEAVVDRMIQTSNDISQSLHLNKHQVVAADKLEASLIYTRFHGISARSNRLIRLLTGNKNTKGQYQQHADHNDAYHTLLTLCRTTYCTHREKLMKLTVRAHMDKLKDQHGLVGMTRIASVFLIRLCTVETQLYLDFFGEHAAVSNDDTTATAETTPTESTTTTITVVDTNSSIINHVEFQTYLNNLCSALHRTVRRGLVAVHDLDTLCQIVSVLREERGQASSSPITMSAARSISSVIEDAQERLIFCANTSLQKEVIRFRASAEDLDYPNKLLKQQQQQPVSQNNQQDDPVQRQLQIYESWFPPMRSVLKILSKIFRVVEPRVFEDIARESIQACARSLKEGSLVILQRSSSQMHADLFLVKHLLILREQLSPFDMDLRSVERQLDFSDAGKAVSRFLANRNRQLFSMSTENALVTLLREGVSVQVQNVDSKRDLEDALRSACNDFIDHTSQSLLMMPSSSSQLPTVLKKSQETLAQQLENVVTQMRLYLDNTATQSILLKPVSRKLYRVMEDMKKQISENANGDDDPSTSSSSELLDILNNLETIVKTTVSSSNSSNRAAVPTVSAPPTTEATTVAPTTETTSADQNVAPPPTTEAT